MTEAEWRAATDPRSMLWFLQFHAEVSARKWMLYCCAEFRSRKDNYNKDERIWSVFEVAERWADGLGTEGERLAAIEVAERARDDAMEARYYAQAAMAAGARDCLAGDIASNIRRLSGPVDYDPHMCDTIEEVFGVLAFRPLTVDPSWLTSTVLAIARGIYESRDFSPMPILADALQDAGCDCDDILKHLRGPDNHLKGCWALDLILGKE